MTLHVSQAHLLKRQPDTSLGRRDALLVCLFLDQGFRCGEVHTLRVKRIDLEAGTVAVSGEKGNSTHHLTHGMRNEIQSGRSRKGKAKADGKRGAWRKQEGDRTFPPSSIARMCLSSRRDCRAV